MQETVGFDNNCTPATSGYLISLFLWESAAVVTARPFTTASTASLNGHQIHFSFPRLKLPVILAITSCCSASFSFETRSRKDIAFFPLSVLTDRPNQKINTFSSLPFLQENGKSWSSLCLLEIDINFSSFYQRLLSIGTQRIA